MMHFSTSQRIAKASHLKNEGTTTTSLRVFRRWGSKGRRQQINSTQSTTVLSPQLLEETTQRFYQGQHYVLQGQWDEAIHLLSLLVVDNPHFLLAWEALAQAYNASGFYQQAYDAFRQTLRLDPFSIERLKKIIPLAERLGLWGEAITYYQRYVAFYPQDCTYLFGCALALEHESQYEEAIRCYDRILSKEQSSLQALNNRAGCYLNLNEWEQAIAGFRHVLKRFPHFSRAILGLGIAQDMSGHFAHAILEYRRYLHLEPHSRHASAIGQRLEELNTQRLL